MVNGSRPITEVKQRRGRSVLGWVTAWEHRVPLPPNTFCFFSFEIHGNDRTDLFFVQVSGNMYHVNS
jgi:hypothetical protein